MLTRRPAVFFGGLLLLLFGPLLQECESDFILPGFPSVTVVNGAERPAAILISLPGGNQSKILLSGESTSWTSFKRDPSTGDIQAAGYLIIVHTSEAYKERLTTWKDYFTRVLVYPARHEDALDAAGRLLLLQFELDALAKERGTACKGSVEPEQNVTVTVVFNEASNKWACG